MEETATGQFSRPPGGAGATRLEGVAELGERRTRLQGEPPAPPPLPAPVLSAAQPRTTRLENDVSGLTAAYPLPSDMRARPTRLEEPVADTGRRTVLHESPGPTVAIPRSTVEKPAPVGGPDVRQLVAVLAAPGLGPGGRVFPVRAGRNLIGAHAKSDICLREDSQVSGEHALILHRGEAFYLADRMSTNGTWVNGEEVDPTNPAIRLGDRDRIRCGCTELIFLRLEPMPCQPASESPMVTESSTVEKSSAAT